MTTGTRAAIRPASPRRIRSWPRGSTRCSPAAGSPTISSVMTLEAQTIARACGKSHVHNLEPEDLVALTVEAAAMARVPLAGTNWIPGHDRSSDTNTCSAAECRGDSRMATDLAAVAKERGIKYFLISYTDLFGALRAKLVPAPAIDDMAKTAPASPASPPGST